MPLPPDTWDDPIVPGGTGSTGTPDTIDYSGYTVPWVQDTDWRANPTNPGAYHNARTGNTNFTDYSSWANQFGYRHAWNADPTWMANPDKPGMFMSTTTGQVVFDPQSWGDMYAPTTPQAAGSRAAGAAQPAGVTPVAGAEGFDLARETLAERAANDADLRAISREQIAAANARQAAALAIQREDSARTMAYNTWKAELDREANARTPAFNIPNRSQLG